MGVIGGLLGGIMGLGQGLIESNTARYNTEATIRANRELAEYQYSKDVDMWNKANEYNSPSAQMLRLKSAGLNPNLVYGSGSVVGNTTGQLPRYNAPTVDYSYKPIVNLSTMLAMYNEFRQGQASYDLVNAQRERVETDNGLKKLQGYFDYGVMPGKAMVIGGSDEEPMSYKSSRNRIAEYEAKLKGYQAQFGEEVNRSRARYIQERVKETIEKIENLKWGSAEKAQSIANMGELNKSIQADVKLKEKQLNWFFINSLVNNITKIGSMFGINKIGGGLGKIGGRSYSDYKRDKWNQGNEYLKDLGQKFNDF